ncbi:flagellar hook-length control protein FliK [Paraburkholderia bonniea]|uniref:flagellar hook-length control protein FliK n=1 Tax=Paraburkholderia bonniea TaxID=2152891 RepID=UPI002572B6BC|nr:flagellar hook-length control protein FliK [Paraburkholderia bonniea]WJF90780.1 flagellar hook-length control protein FliK [Paraburkholderia bonniea]WJF94094.1 flagellar hook-length control protein FliK [Paraburkholderia bonniea]
MIALGMQNHASAPASARVKPVALASDTTPGAQAAAEPGVETGFSLVAAETASAAESNAVTGAVTDGTDELTALPSEQDLAVLALPLAEPALLLPELTSDTLPGQALPQREGLGREPASAVLAQLSGSSASSAASASSVLSGAAQASALNALPQAPTGVLSAALRQQLAAAGSLPSGMEREIQALAAQAPALAEPGLRRAQAAAEPGGLAAAALPGITAASATPLAAALTSASAMTTALRAQLAERGAGTDSSALGVVRREAGDSSMNASLFELPSASAGLKTTQASASATADVEAPGQKLLQALGERISLQSQQGIQRAVIRLDPHLAGSVLIELRQTGGAVQVHMSATNGDVLRQLQTISDGLRQELGNRQFNEVTVQVSATRMGQHESGGQGRDAQQHEREQRATDPGQGLAAASSPGAHFELAS